jgi:putative inorganic carbon (HCO3(-)) transporter
MENNKSRIKFVYLVGFFLILVLPLLNLPPWFSPPDWGKTIVFRIILSILIFIFLYQTLSKKQLSIKTSLPFWLLIVLFGIYFLATIFSLDRSFSLWGSPYRSGGFINFALYIIFAILAFLIIQQKDWQLIWDFSIVIGIFVSIIAIFQQFGLISKIFIPFESRPPSTIGGPIFLAIFLLLLSFLILSFGIATKNIFKKIFYLFAFLLFIFVIIFTAQTKAAFVGLTIGLCWFFFFYPKKLTLFKVLVLIFLISGTFSVYFLKIHPEAYKNRPYIVRDTIGSIVTIFSGVDPSRISAWKVSIQALKNRPILGYGPENFSIGFDKYYDPALPEIGKVPGGLVTSWWDRAHNFVFDIALTAGIPALIIYLSLLGVLFWELQKLKHTNPLESGHESSRIIAHGIQAAFLAYLAANFFSFDTFSTYLISFLLIGYSLYIISKNISEKKFSLTIKGESIITSILFLGLVLFIWNFNIKPFQVNSKINEAKNLVEKEKCEEMIPIMEEELDKKSYLDSYLRLKYAEFMGDCEKSLSKKIDFYKKISELFKEGTEIRPYYTRNWILLGGIDNILIAKEKNPEIKEKLKQEANFYLEKAHQLSPKRQEVYTEWINTDILTGEYEKAKEKSQRCIDLNPKLGYCWWLLGLSNIYLNNHDAAQENINIAGQKGYLINSEASLSQLVAAYSKSKNYLKLIEAYQGLINIKPEEPQFHASLAFTYKEIGQFKKAREEALIVLKIAPELKEEVEEFLKTLE